MPNYFVDEELAETVASLARQDPFEKIDFNEALRRLLDNLIPQKQGSSGSGVADTKPFYIRKTPSPKASEWVKTVPDLYGEGHFTTWKSVCNYLNIDTAGDSARRRLKNWVEINRPHWPQVPDV